MWYFRYFWYSGLIGLDLADRVLKFMENGYKIRIQHVKDVLNSYLWVFNTNLTSCIVQCRFVVGIFWYSGQLGLNLTGQILKFMENRYKIRIQHVKNVLNNYLCVFKTNIISCTVECSFVVL